MFYRFSTTSNLLSSISNDWCNFETLNDVIEHTWYGPEKKNCMRHFKNRVRELLAGKIPKQLPGFKERIKLVCQTILNTC